MMRPGSLEQTPKLDAASSQAILVASRTGRIQFVTARGARWLKDFSFPSSGRLTETLAVWIEDVLSTTGSARFVLDRAGTQLCFEVICREASSICVLLERTTQASRSNGLQGRLTRRQSEVLSWVARGKTNAEIAQILSLKTGTIGKYLERIFPKLGVENRTAAASFVLGTNHTN